MTWTPKNSDTVRIFPQAIFGCNTVKMAIFEPLTVWNISTFFLAMTKNITTFFHIGHLSSDTAQNHTVYTWVVCWNISTIYINGGEYFS